MVAQYDDRRADEEQREADEQQPVTLAPRSSLYTPRTPACRISVSLVLAAWDFVTLLAAANWAEVTDIVVAILRGCGEFSVSRRSALPHRPRYPVVFVALPCVTRIVSLP